MDALPVQLMKDGKPNITATVAAFGRQLFAFIRKRVNTTEDAEDILQDVFYQLADNAGPIEKLGAWLYSVARNRITDNYRKKKPEALDMDDEEDWLFTDQDDPESEYMRSLVWPALYDALDELPTDQKEAFVLHELEGIPFAAMAEMTGVPTATLISRKRYAVLHLRERLESIRNELLHL